MKLTDLRFTHSITPFLFLFYSVSNTAADEVPAPQYLKLGHDLSRPIAAVIVLLVFVFFIMVFLFVYLRHYLELNAATDAALRAAAGTDRCGIGRGLDPDVIRTFPVVAHSQIKDTKFAEWSLECAVCLSEFRDCETLRLLTKCGHVFHPACIDAWLASCATCPICRAMLAAGGRIPRRNSSPSPLLIGVMRTANLRRSGRAVRIKPVTWWLFVEKFWWIRRRSDLIRDIKL